MTNRKTLLNELPSYGFKGTTSYIADLAKSKVGLADDSTVQLKAMVSDLVYGVSDAPTRFFTWFSQNIGMSVGGIRKYFGSICKSVGPSNNIFMKVIHKLGSAIGTAINYAVKLLSPLIAQAETFMGANISGLYGVTNGQLIACAVIFSYIVFIIYKIYKRIKNRKSKKHAQPQTPQEVVEESKEMLHDTMEAITDGIHTFKCCDYLVEMSGLANSVRLAVKAIANGGKLCYKLFRGLFGKNSDDQSDLGETTNATEGFNIFERDYYDRGSSNLTILQNKVFLSIALLCIAVVLGFFAFTNLVTDISAVLNSPGYVSSFFNAIFGSRPVGIFDIQKVVLNPKVIGLATGAGVAYKASKQIGPVREYR